MKLIEISNINKQITKTDNQESVKILPVSLSADINFLSYLIRNSLLSETI